MKCAVCGRRADIICGRCGKNLCPTHAHPGVMKDPCPEELVRVLKAIDLPLTHPEWEAGIRDTPRDPSSLFEGRSEPRKEVSSGEASLCGDE